MNFNEKLIDLRKSRGLSQEELGAERPPPCVLAPGRSPWDSLCARKLREISFIWLFCDATCLLSPPLPVCWFTQA